MLQCRYKGSKLSTQFQAKLPSKYLTSFVKTVDLWCIPAVKSQGPQFGQGARIERYKELTARIKRVQSVGELKVIVWKHGDEFNHIHVTAALAKLAKLASSGPVSGLHRKDLQRWRIWSNSSPRGP